MGRWWCCGGAEAVPWWCQTVRVHWTQGSRDRSWCCSGFSGQCCPHFPTWSGDNCWGCWGQEPLQEGCHSFLLVS